VVVLCLMAAGAIALRAGLSTASLIRAEGRQPCGSEVAAPEPATSPSGEAPAVPAAVPPTPGGTLDAPGAPDGRPEEFHPDDAAFRALVERLGATILMSSFRTSFSHASPSQAANIALVAKKLTGVVVPPGAVFSYNATVGPYTRAGGYGWGRQFVGDRIVPTIGGGVCQGASTLYNAVLLANLEVVERHPHGLTVPYLPPGRDATVTESGGLDFRFRNNTPGPVVLWGQAEQRWLTLAIYGTVHPPRVEIETQVLARTPFRTEVIVDRRLPPGSEQVAAAGQQGATARTWVIVHYPDGRVRRTYLGQHTYRPSPRILLRGPTPPSGRPTSRTA
jgi:vancomycin resistance protein VanW